MKKIFFIVLFAFAAFSANAQFHFGGQFNINFANEHTDYASGKVDNKEHAYMINLKPKVYWNLGEKMQENNRKEITEYGKRHQRSGKERAGECGKQGSGLVGITFLRVQSAELEDSQHMGGSQCLCRTILQCQWTRGESDRVGQTNGVRIPDPAARQH